MLLKKVNKDDDILIFQDQRLSTVRKQSMMKIINKKLSGRTVV